MDLERAKQALVAAHRAGDEDAARKIAEHIQAQQQQQAQMPMPQRLAQQGAQQLEVGGEFFRPHVPLTGLWNPDPAREGVRPGPTGTGFMGDALSAVLGGGGRTAADVGAGMAPEAQGQMLERGAGAAQGMLEASAMAALLMSGARGGGGQTPGPAEALRPRPATSAAAGLKAKAREIEQAYRRSKGIAEPIKGKGFKSPEAQDLWKRASGMETLEGIINTSRGNAEVIRRQLISLTKNRKEFGRFTPDQQGAIRHVIDGGNIGRLLQAEGAIKTALRSPARVIGRSVDRRATERGVRNVIKGLE